MQLLSLQHRPRKSGFIVNTGFILFVLFSFALSAQGQTVVQPQSESSSFAPADSEFTMQVSRVNNEVLITLTFNDSLVFDYVSIERRADFNAEFSQCKYISYDEVKTKGRHMVKKDTYAYAGASNVLYRLKLVTKDGERTFPALTLPAIKK
jgi:hypothetical protein